MMASNKEMQTGLKAMAEDFHLPGGGRMKLSRLVARHLVWFSIAEQRGMSWRDIARALAASGITSETGQPASIGTLSSTVWRQRSALVERADHDARPGQRLTAETAVDNAQRSKSKAPAHVRTKLCENQVELSSTGQNDDHPKAAMKSKRPNTKPVGKSENLLAFMARAHAIRRRSE